MAMFGAQQGNRSLAGVWLPVLAMLAFGGCTSLPEPPRIRIGSLPCPGALTLFSLADPDDLGMTRYGEWPRLLASGETSRGILYTRKAGFIDLAHLRMAMDWVRYASLKIEPALRQKRQSVEFPGQDFSTFRLKFSYPRDWDSAAAGEGGGLITDLAREIAQRVAFDAMTWHEITTWYGYRTTVVWPETPSSFTFEDSMSHIVGIYAGGRALQYGVGAWDRDATASLNHTLKQLDVVSRQEAARVVDRIEDTWCEHAFFNPRRMVDLGQKTGRIYPWLVPETTQAGSGTYWFPVPGGPKSINGRDYSQFCTVEIKPQLLTPSRIRDLCPGRPQWIDTAKHFPLILEDVRRQLRAKYGPQADRPYDQPTSAP